MTITATPKEIADLVSLLQNQQEVDTTDVDVANAIGSAIRDTLLAIQ